MNTNIKLGCRYRQTVVGLALGLGMALGSASAVLAQTSAQPANPLQGLGPESSSDPFSNRGNSQMNSLFDLVHRAMQGQGRSLNDYSADQQDNLDSAAADFRAKQRQRLQTGGQAAANSDSAGSTAASGTASTPQK